MQIEKVLLIDDDAIVRRVCEIALERVGGWQVTAAESGAHGLILAASVKPDVILLDVMMPKMDGPTTLQKLRESPETAGIPVIFMTAKVQKHELTNLLTLGAAGVIPKPFDPLTLPIEITAIVSELSRQSA